MKAFTIRGHLIYIDTDERIIRITEDGKDINLKISPSTRVPGGFEAIIGQDVEAVVINDKVRHVSILQNEE